MVSGELHSKWKLCGFMVCCNYIFRTCDRKTITAAEDIINYDFSFSKFKFGLSGSELKFK